MSPMMTVALTVAGAVLAVALGAVAVLTRRRVITTGERTVHATLHTAGLAARPLRRGLDEESARAAAPHLLVLTESDGLAIYDPQGKPLWLEPPDEPIWTAQTRAACRTTAAESIAGRRRVLRRAPAPAVVAQPLLDEDGTVLGALIAVNTAEPAPGMLGAIGEVARYAASQLQLAELDASRARLDRAEVLALRAQISPHFVYNALSLIPLSSGIDLNVFPLRNPGLISIPFGFFMGWLGTVTSKERDMKMWAELEVRSLTGADVGKPAVH